MHQDAPEPESGRRFPLAYSAVPPPPPRLIPPPPPPPPARSSSSSVRYVGAAAVSTPGAPVSRPVISGRGLVLDPSLVATRRPWQVTVFGWWQIFGVVASVVVEVVWWVWYFEFSDELRSIDGLDGVSVVWLNRDLFTAVAAVTPFLIALDLFIAVAYLRGSRGAYSYYTVIAIARLVLLVLLPIAYLVVVYLYAYSAVV